MIAADRRPGAHRETVAPACSSRSGRARDPQPRDPATDDETR
jgi:hypothetical protein